jgi:metallo-beta-lactamase family protein
MPTLTFLGAARTVTGSKYLLELGTRRLLVDCGLFQGLKELRERNWAPLPVNPATVDAVVLTHAHLDHIGYLPRLVADGFRGRIFCTPGTADLCRIVLPDAGRLAEEEARDANRHKYTKHEPALPLFSEADAYRAVSQLQPVGYERPMPVTDGVEIEYLDAGHLLGSAFIRMRLESGRLLLFGGDLGRYGRPVLPDPRPVEAADVLLVESTYGDRVHDQDDDGKRLADIVQATLRRGGKLIIPSFAIGRVEELMYWLKALEDAKRIPIVPVFLDSPMAMEALDYYGAHSGDLDADVRTIRGQRSPLFTKRFQPVSSAQQSQELVASRAPSIVISSSGMATGGRVLHHLKAALPDSRNTVLFVGYQAQGTRGRQLVDGMGQVKIHGLMVKVAARIEKIDSMSAHADSQEIVRWLGGFTRPPATTYLVHGEPGPMDALKSSIEKKYGWTVRTPEYLETVEI